MIVGGGLNAHDPAETILTAVHMAKHSTLLKRRLPADVELHAQCSEGLSLIQAFARIENPAVRTMLTQVVEMLADAMGRP